MNRPLHRKLISLAGLIAFFLAQPLANVLYETSGIPEGAFTTLFWSLAVGVIGYGVDGLGFARTSFVTMLIAGTIIHTVTPLGEWVQLVAFVSGTTVAFSIMTYFEGEGLKSQ